MAKMEVLIGDIFDSDADTAVFISNTCLPGGEELIKSITKRAGGDDVFKEVDIALEEPVPDCKAKKIIRIKGYEYDPKRSDMAAAMAERFNKCLALAEKEKLETLDFHGVPAGAADSKLFQCATTQLDMIRRQLMHHEYPKNVRIFVADEKSRDMYMNAYNYWFAGDKADRMMNGIWDTPAQFAMSDKDGTDE